MFFEFVSGSWLYDRDPLEPLRFEEPLAKLRSRLAAGEPVFENLIKKYLLENGHKVSVKVIPPPLDSAIRTSDYTFAQVYLCIWSSHSHR
jgi:Zn-dependent M16 (insulinase) family peptidase